MERICRPTPISFSCQGADNSFARTERAQVEKHVRRRARFQQHRDASCHQVLFPARRGAEGNLRHYDRNINLFLPGRAKDLSAPLYTSPQFTHCIITPPTPFPLYDKATHTMAYNFTETFTIFCLLSTTQHTN